MGLYFLVMQIYRFFLYLQINFSFFLIFLFLIDILQNNIIILLTLSSRFSAKKRVKVILQPIFIFNSKRAKSLTTRFPETPYCAVENSKLLGCGIINHHSRCRINDIKMRTRYLRKDHCLGLIF